MTQDDIKKEKLRIRQHVRVCALSEALGLTKKAVSAWKRVPAERVLEVEQLTGWSRYDQRPDIFGSPPGLIKKKILPGRLQQSPPKVNTNNGGDGEND
jgi:hypothetical protein